MIGVFGGTFDPIHYGHLRCALEVKEIFALDELRLIVSATPPHREQPQASAPMRLAMLQLALTNQQGFMCDTRELDRPGLSYMVDTLHSLRIDFPETPILLFIGNDAFNHLTSWHRWQNLFDYAHIVVMTRPLYQTQTLNDFLLARLTEQQQHLKKPSGKLYFQSVTPLDISATAIRNIIRQNNNPQYLLPDTVIEFIKHNKLYET
jgi:nicotinate-nucleotide adenylyltransferase